MRSSDSTEFRAKGTTVEYVVLGLGLNVNWCPEDSTLFPSTSLLLESQRELSRNELIASVLLQYNEIYQNILAGDLEGFHKKCNDHSLVSGNSVSINTQGEIVEGKALGIDVDGALLIRGKDGKTRKIWNGDVSLRPL